MNVTSFKCGPDYIDPMFHNRVIGTKSRNLDTFFTGEEITRHLLVSGASDCDMAVMEGVMGFYDGVAGITTTASAYDLAVVTDTPVILIVNAKGMSVSLAAYIKGFLEYKKNSHIKGVIFNQMSPMLYPRMKELVENELDVKVLGYLPRVDECVLESRHLGLVLPEEIPELQAKLKQLAEILERTLEIDEIVCLAESAPDLPDDTEEKLQQKTEVYGFTLTEPVRIAVADDPAFCFFYEDNFQLLQKMGAELIHFSPIFDSELPPDVNGLLLYGGYPELHAEKLEQNLTMRMEIRQKIMSGLPVIAECGGFMYLHDTIEDMDGIRRQMAGVIPGHVFRTSHLNRFGYIRLEQKIPVFGEEALGEISAHEFHYFESENCGEDFRAQKPLSNRHWDCIHAGERMLAGFPHLHYYSNPNVAKAFLKQCMQYKNGQQKGMRER